MIITIISIVKCCSHLQAVIGMRYCTSKHIWQHVQSVGPRAVHDSALKSHLVPLENALKGA